MDSANVLPSSTMSKVDDFIATQMLPAPLSDIRKKVTQDGACRTKYIPRFTVDGYGRWREVQDRQNHAIQSPVSLRDPSMLEIYRRVLQTDNLESIPTSSRYSSTYSSSKMNTPRADNASILNFCNKRPSTNSSFQSYKHLSTSLRSNVFPGIGKEKWESSTKTAFNSQSIPTSWVQQTENFGVTKDAYMKWAEQDVYRQRLMKAWDKYIADAPKPARQVLKVVKEEKSREKQTEKDAKKKSKQKKKKTIPEKNGSSNEGPKENEIQTRRIEVQPANPDEDFWDFYEKPFAQS